MAYVDRSQELSPPTIDDYELVKAAALDLASLPEARSEYTENQTIVTVRRLYIDFDFIVWPPFVRRAKVINTDINGDHESLVIHLVTAFDRTAPKKAHVRSASINYS